MMLYAICQRDVERTHALMPADKQTDRALTHSRSQCCCCEAGRQCVMRSCVARNGHEMTHDMRRQTAADVPLIIGRYRQRHS